VLLLKSDHIVEVSDYGVTQGIPLCNGVSARGKSGRFAATLKPAVRGANSESITQVCEGRLLIKASRYGEIAELQ